MEDAMEVDSDVELANSYIAGRLAPKSKDQYGRKVKTFEEWMKRKHPEKQLLGEVDYTKIDSETMKAFVGYISRKRDKKLITAENPDGNVKPIKNQSYEHVSGYKSAIKNAYRDKKIVVTSEIDGMFRDVFDGYKRKIGELKQTGEMPILEGKQALNFSGYRFLANQAIMQKTDLDVAVFVHLFLLLCWNLIARCCSVSSIMYDHISWDNDAMVIVFATHKGDKEAADCSPKHVFANPSNPEICPILWFAVYIWCQGFRRSGSKRTVFGFSNSVEDRFGNWLRNVLGTHADALLTMGVVITGIGTHSFRKGVAT